MMGRQQKPVRWKACVPAVVNAFDMAVGALYVERYFQHEDKREALNMIHHLQVDDRDFKMCLKTFFRLNHDVYLILPDVRYLRQLSVRI